MRPPLERWLVRLIGPRDREFIAGDLREAYGRRHAAEGRRAAAWWYVGQIAAALGQRILAAVRDARGSARPGVTAVAQDLRYAGRAIRRTPAHAALVTVTLALGIGATTAVFTVVDRVLLRPPPFPEPHELVAVWNTYPGWRGHEVLGPFWDRITFSWPEYVDWREGQTSFRAVAAYDAKRMTLTESGSPALLDVGLASATLFPLLGVEPVLGRTFAPDEEGPAAPRVALLGHAMWRDRWAGSPDAIGSTLRLDGTAFTIIGVLPERFRFRTMGSSRSTGFDVWIPVGSDGDALHRDSHAYETIARLPEGAIGPAVIEETGRIVGGDAYPERRGARVVARHEEEVGEAREPLVLLFVAVGLLMTIACVNVAALFLGRVLSRRAELATRAALGAGRWRILRQLSIEALVLGGLGVAGGLAVGYGGVRVLVTRAPAVLDLPPGVGLDVRVLAFSIALGLVTSLVFGLAPAALLRRGDLDGQLRRASGRLLSGGRRFQRALVAAQFALSLLLLVGAGLLGRSLAAELAVDPGFETETLLSFDLALPPDGYPTNDARSAFFRAAVERLGAIPEVADVSGITSLPFSGTGGSSSFQIVGGEVPESRKKPEALRRSALPGFHDALGIGLLRGRSLLDTDRDEAAPVVVISRTMKERFWPGVDAIGERIERDGREWAIVGVVEDVLDDNLIGEPKPTFYTPFHQEEDEIRARLTLVLKSSTRPARIAPQIRDAIWELDSSLPIENLEEVQSLLDRVTAPQRYRTLLLSLFAVLATSLAAVGIFGVTTRTLVHLSREMGIRTALGAGPGRLIGQVVGGETPALVGGVLAGVAAAVFASRALAPFLYGVPRIDPLTYAGAAGFLAAAGLAAALLAARRVARLDPARVLRAD